MLKDSGQRREFESGAVRDICEGKGRCDLLPLDVVGTLIEYEKGAIVESSPLSEIGAYLYENQFYHLHRALTAFIRLNFKSVEEAMLEVSKHFERARKSTASATGRKAYRSIALSTAECGTISNTERERPTSGTTERFCGICSAQFGHRSTDRSA